MKRIAFLIVILLILIGGAFAPSYSQKDTLRDADSTYENKTMGNKFAYTYLYINSVRTSGNDSLMIYTYNPGTNGWIPAKLINLTLNTETTAGSPIVISNTTNIFAFYEMFLYGFKIVRTNFVGGNDDRIYLFIKNIQGGG